MPTASSIPQSPAPEINKLDSDLTLEYLKHIFDSDDDNHARSSVQIESLKNSKQESASNEKVSHEKEIYQLKIQQCRDFAQQYTRLMCILFSIILSKRLFFDPQSNIYKLTFHFLIVGLLMLSLRLHRTSDLATRIVPLLIGALSYYGHTRFLLFNKHLPKSLSETNAA